MAGNVEEWTSDFYLPYPGGLAVVDDAGGPGVARISRGGSYRGLGDLARCARRHAHFEGARIGARLVLASA
jgi:formylglycine-generating enzyme required for sulfatase activity